MRWDVLETTLLSDSWATLTKTRLRFTFQDGTVSEQLREVYDRGDGAVILPFDPDRGHVLLGKQFRFPAAYREDPDPFLIEAAAGLLDDASPAERIREEAEEELGLTLNDVKYLFAAYMSPGSVSEQLHFFVATYSADPDRPKFGGLREEGEEIEIFDLPLGEALTMIKDGRIRDGKTIMLLQYAALYLMPEAGK